MNGALRYCTYPGCRVLVPKGRCTPHRRDQERTRPNVDIRKLYRTPRWAAYRRQKQADDPLCVDCQAEGQYVPWTELDHEVPHRGDLTLFWDYSNLRGRCRTHHQAKTGRGE